MPQKIRAADPAGNAPAPASDRRTVYQFAKNSREQVCASVSHFHGGVYADLRVFAQGPNGELFPTKKGLTIAPELVDELAQAVRLLQAAFPDR